MSTVLIVDDEPSVCWALERYLTRRGHTARSVATVAEALGALDAETPGLVLLDVRLPDGSGLDALTQIRERSDAPPVIVITAHGTMDTAVEAMRRGAFDYLTKPVDLAAADEVIGRALARLEAADDVAPSPEAVAMVGSSPQMQAVYKQIGTVAASDASVLITGESGTGKELVARAIHQASDRRDGPFEPLVCASLPESLLEGELYGHEAGAFTGATARRIGRLERAAGGTLFLDEVSEIPLSIQVKLLRFLEERQLERLGGGDRIAIDIRLIAATNRPLDELVRRGQFREDLLYRMQVVRIDLPPLRRRLSDLPELVGRFLAAGGQAPPAISRDALDRLRRYYWPGNVRELRHAVEHAVVLSRGSMIAPEHLPPYLLGPATPAPGDDQLQALLRAQVEAALVDGAGELYDRLLARWERALLAPVLAHTEGNQLQAARLLGVSRGTLRKKLRQAGLLEGPES